eukprot:TRINITY_DN8797_c0_g1_i1.p1 TRINITY_DN8797_c0_g1~~TRINITY_DN8797_c0_g1_i1.p1  ORF type:complete len:273 (-),score=45.77 TRINITY_DN8797_c0_g1_i1:452-1270(-)
MASFHEANLDAEDGFKRELELETEAPTDSEIGSDSDVVAAFITAFTDGACTDPHRFFGTGVTGESFGQRVTETLVRSEFSPGEPAKLFGFDHLAPHPVAGPPMCPGINITRWPTLSMPVTLPPLAPSVQMTLDRCSSTVLIKWTVDARKLSSKDNVIVSPSFELPLANLTPFKIMLRPKQTSLRKGGSCFHKSVGVGTVHVKCEAGLLGEAGIFTLRSSVGKQALCQKIRHDFSQSAAWSMPEDCYFSDAVDATTRSFAVNLEISKSCPTMW